MQPATHRLATMEDVSSSRHVLVHSNKEKNDNDKDDYDEQINLLILLTLEGACGRWRQSKDNNNNNDWWCPETCLSDKDLHCQHQWIRQWQRLLWKQKKCCNWNNLRNARYPHWNVYHLLFSSARPQQVCCSNLRVLNALYKAWPQGLSYPDAIFGRLPLHLAVQAQAPWKILHRMIALYPSSVMHLDKHGYRPIHGLLLLLLPNNNHQYGTFPQPPMWYIQDVARLLFQAQLQVQSGLVLQGPLDQKLLESNILGPILIEVLQTHSRRMTKLCIQDMTIDSSMLQPRRLLSCYRRIKHLELRNVRGSGFVDEVLSLLALQRRRSLERLILVDCDLHSIDVLDNFLFQTSNSKSRFLGQPRNTKTNHLLVDLSDNPFENVSPNQWERVLPMSNKNSVLFAGTSLPPSVLQACSIDYIVAAMNYYSNRPQVLYYLLQHRMDLLLEVNK